MIPLLHIDCEIPFRLNTFKIIDVRSSSRDYQASLQEISDHLRNLPSRYRIELTTKLEKLKPYRETLGNVYSRQIGQLEAALARWDAYDNDPSLGVYGATGTDPSSSPPSRQISNTIDRPASQVPLSPGSIVEIPFAPSTTVSPSRLIKLILAGLNMAILFSLGFYFAGDSFLGYSQIITASIISFIIILLISNFTTFGKWLDRQVSIPILNVVTFAMMLVVLAVIRPSWARISVREPTPVRDEYGALVGQLQPGMFSVTVLGISDNREWYLVECPIGFMIGFMREECWVLIEDRVQKQGIEVPLPVVNYSINEINTTATFQAIQTLDRATVTAARQFVATAYAATATQGANQTAIRLTITAENYNTATRDAANAMLTQTAVSAGTAVAKTQLAEIQTAMIFYITATREATAAVLSQTARAEIDLTVTQLFRGFTETAIASTDTPVPTATPTPSP